MGVQTFKTGLHKNLDLTHQFQIFELDIGFQTEGQWRMEVEVDPLADPLGGVSPPRVEEGPVSPPRADEGTASNLGAVILG